MLVVRKKHVVLICLCLFAFLLSSCTNDSTPSTKEPKVIRDNTPVIRLPKASNTKTIGNDRIIFDVSNTKDGYIMVTYKGTNPKVKVRITNPKEKDPYTYDVVDGYNVYPLTGSNGSYEFSAYENISDDRYSLLYKGNVEVTLKNEYTAFLYPNQFVNYNGKSKAIEEGKKIAEGASNDLDVVAKVYAYMIEHVTYDEDKADLVKQGKLNGYLPVVDEILDTKKGICFDYAALMATMLRTQNIPTRLMIGYATMNKVSFYHAWIGVYIKDIGWVDNIIEFDGNNWSMMDPTLASENHNSDTIKDFISNKNNYLVKYLY